MGSLRRFRPWLLSVFLGVVACDGTCGCVQVKAGLVTAFTPTYEAEGDTTRVVPEFTGADEARPRLAVVLTPVARGLTNATDVQFAPGDAETMYVLQKEGEAKWFHGPSKESGVWLTLEVNTDSEEGLLGLAFHPRFSENGRLYLNYSVQQDDGRYTRIAEWRVPPGESPRTASPTLHHVVLEVQQPYPNHNAGQLAFGPDGMLYVGFGDGGYADDPHGHGQNRETFLGSMLRLDVDTEPYAVPKDNPFVGEAGVRPELWAWGLRNPWRYTFAPDGRMVVADVGQDTWEEVDLVRAGDNLGWNTMEGLHCFPPDEAEACEKDGLVQPIYEYDHEEGRSITGGQVYTGARIPALKGLYVFGDFATGRLWALPLPETQTPGASLKTVKTLGKWPVLPAAFGKDPSGEVYLADFYQGVVYRLDPVSAGGDEGPGARATPRGD